MVEVFRGARVKRPGATHPTWIIAKTATTIKMVPDQMIRDRSVAQVEFAKDLQSMQARNVCQSSE